MRVVLVRLESRWRRLLVLSLVTASAAWVAGSVAGPVVARVLAARPATPADLERAVVWDPGSPELRLRLAGAYATALEGADLARGRHHAEAALRLRPTHAGTWLSLALLADAAGHPERARQALQTAVRLNRESAALRWEAALLHMRWGEREPAFEHARYVLAVDPERRNAAFHLARLLLGSEESVASLLPTEAEPLTSLLRSAIRKRELDLAQAVWEKRVRLLPAIPDDLNRRFLDLLVEQGQGPAARRAWLAIAPGGEVAAAPDNAVWNGSFETDRLLGWGLDWQVRPAGGVEVRLDRSVAAQGSQSLRLAFSSFPTLDFAGVSQIVPVEPGGEYRLRAVVRARDFVTRPGLRLQVVTLDGEQVLAETDAVAGATADWAALEARLEVPPELSLVRVRLRREKAPGTAGSLGGQVWVDGVSLTPVRRRGA
jgi:tetratricopeptide (TPR) repeat protein